jgi:hypothetical protein
MTAKRTNSAMSTQLPTSNTSRFNPLSALWRIAMAPQTLATLLALLAFVLLLGYLIPQIPAAAAANPQAWLAAQPGLSGNAGDLVRSLRLYDISHALWVDLILVLIGLTAFVWAFETAELAWRATRRKTWPIDSLAWWKRSGIQTRLPTTLSAEEAMTCVNRFLTGHKYRQIDLATAPGQGLIAARRAFLLWMPPTAYSALVAIMIGLVIVGNWGWQNEDRIPAIGDKNLVGHGLPLAVRLDGFASAQGQQGNLRLHRSEITWLENDTDRKQDTASFGSPSRYQGVTVRQVGYVPVATLAARDDGGRLLSLQSEGQDIGSAGAVQILFSSAADQPIVFLPGQERFLALSFDPDCADGRPALYVDLLQDGGEKTLASGSLQESGTLVLDDLEISLTLDYRPILRIDYRPASGLVVGGMIVLVAALVSVWLLSPRLVWLTPESDETGLTIVQIVIPPGLKGNRWLPQLAGQLGKVLADDD